MTRPTSTVGHMQLFIFLTEIEYLAQNHRIQSITPCKPAELRLKSIFCPVYMSSSLYLLLGHISLQTVEHTASNDNGT